MGRQARDRVQVVAKAWVVVGVEAEWAGRTRQGQVEIASVRAAATVHLMLPDSLVIREPAPGAASQ